MRKSEIFESFIKIAQEKGMISEDAPDKAKKKLEQNPRGDSLDMSAIEALYGVKPDLPKDMEYKRNIMEDAHPNSVVISPSYDKLNGLVENNIERQNILLHIVHKTPDGLLTQRKYAEQEFILSLVRVANDLDNRNIEELRVLADTCLLQVSPQQLRKEAVGPLAVVGGIAAILGGLYLQQHLPMVNEGFEANHKKLLSELDDMLNSSSSWGVGYDYKADFIKTLQDFKNKLDAFYQLYKKNETVFAELEKPKTAKELLDKANAGEGNQVMEAYQEMKSAFDNILPYLMNIQKEFSSEFFKGRQVADKGFFSSLIDKTEILHGGKGLIADDFDDVARAIPPYLDSVRDMLGILKNTESFSNDVKQQIMAAAAKSQQLFDAGPTEAPAAEPAPDTDQEVENLEKDLQEGLI